MKIVSHQARGGIWHTSQEWQSNLIGIDRAANTNAFQNQVAASSPRMALDFSENHAATRDRAPKLHRAFHNRHLKCFLSIIFFTKFEIIDPLLFYNFAGDFPKARAARAFLPPSRAARADSPSEARRPPIPCAFLKCGPRENRTPVSTMRMWRRTTRL